MTDQLAEIARSMKELTHHVKTQTRILETLNQNLVQLALRLPDQTDKPTEGLSFCVMSPQGNCIVKEHNHVEKDRIFGWTTASLMQSRGTLQVGDIKTESDESRWIWIGETWERLEEPSARVD